MFRASAHHVISREPRPGSRSVWQVYTGKLITCYQGVHYQIITGKHVYLRLFSLLCFKIKWFEMRAPNQIFSRVIFLYRGKHTGLRHFLKCFMFLFLGNGARKVFPSTQRSFFRWKPVDAHNVPWPGMKILFSIVSVSQVIKRPYPKGRR